jgi:hypothetical protein
MPSMECFLGIVICLNFEMIVLNALLPHYQLVLNPMASMG